MLRWIISLICVHWGVRDIGLLFVVKSEASRVDRFKYERQFLVVKVLFSSVVGCDQVVR